MSERRALPYTIEDPVVAERIQANFDALAVVEETEASTSTDLEGATGTLLQGQGTGVEPVFTATPQVSRLGAGAAADTTAVGKFTGQYFSPLVSHGSLGASETVNWDAGNEHYGVLDADCTFTFSNPKDGGRYVLLLKQDGTGGRNIILPASVKWKDGTTPTFTTMTANQGVLITLMYVTALTYYVAACNFPYDLS